MFDFIVSWPAVFPKCVTAPLESAEALEAETPVFACREKPLDRIKRQKHPDRILLSDDRRRIDFGLGLGSNRPAYSGAGRSRRENAIADTM